LINIIKVLTFNNQYLQFFLSTVNYQLSTKKMAKTGPGILGKISGSIGGTQFRQTRYGTVVCNTTNPVNRWSPSKQTSTIRFGNASQLWAKVKHSEVENWKSLADTCIKTDKLGNEFFMRGLDLFKQLNRQLVEINEPVIFTAPKKVFPKIIVSPEFEILGDKKLEDIRLFFKFPVHKDTKYIIFATPMLKSGINSPKPSWYRKIAVIDSAFLSGYSLLNEYLAVFITFGNTHRIGFKIKPVSIISGFTLPVIPVFCCPE
jgi:hypothetical protein